MKRICTLTLGLGILAFATSVRADNVDFQGFTPGQPVTQAGFGNGVFTVTATDNNAFGPQTATVIDTDVNRPNQTDMEFPFKGGNLKTTRLRKVLVVQRAPGAANFSQAGGELDLTFSNPLKSFGFDVLDMETNNAAASTVTFKAGGAPLATIPFSAFTTVGSPYKNVGVVFGDNTANRIKPILNTQVGGDFDEVVFDFNDPTGIDTLNYKLQTVPEPTAAAGLLLGLPLLARRRRKA